MDGLFFTLSKILWSLVRPEGWLLLLVLLTFVSLLFNRRRLALVCSGLASACYLTIALVPLGDLLLRPLEGYAQALPQIEHPAAIVVLGGGEEADRSAGSGLPSVNDAGERFLAAIDLARRFPQADVVFTGGTGWFREDAPPGANVAGQIFAQAGIDAARVILEGRSLNTWQNAVNTLPLMEGVSGDGPFVLVTSAFHMRRSLAAFCAAGWRNLVAYPTDFRAVSRSVRLGWQFTANLRELDLAVKEWIGLVAYSRSGRAVDPQTTPKCLATTLNGPMKESQAVAESTEQQRFHT